jgi:hypothetical protein
MTMSSERFKVGISFIVLSAHLGRNIFEFPERLNR